MNKLTVVVLLIVCSILFFATGFGVGTKTAVNSEQALYNKRVALYKPWFPISKDVQNKVMDKSVYIRSGKNAGSGCKIKPGYYLTALHVLVDSFLGDSPIAVDNMKATVVAHSDPDRDIAIVSTFAEFSKEDALLGEYNEFEDDQDIIIVGGSGPIDPFAQPGKILRDAINDDLAHTKKQGAKIISGQYIDHGISGGCVYSADGEKLLGIVTKKYESSSIGEVSQVSKSIK